MSSSPTAVTTSAQLVQRLPSMSSTYPPPSFPLPSSLSPSLLLPSPLPPSPLSLPSSLLPLTQLLCIITEKEEDVAAFKDYQEPPTSSPLQEKVFTPHTHEMPCLLGALQWLRPVCCTTCRQHPRRMCLLPRPPASLPRPLMYHQCPSHPPLVCLSVHTLAPFWPSRAAVPTIYEARGTVEL